MALTFVKSQKGTDMLLLDGFLFTKEKSLDNRICWKCVEYNRGKCPARRHTSNNEVIKIIGEHNHVPDVAAVKKKEVMYNIKERANNSQDSNHVIVAECTAGLALSVQGKLPSVGSIKRTVQRSRQRNGDYPANPNSLLELLIPRKYCTISNENQQEETFLQFDSGETNDRILVFSTKKNLELMSRCQHWYADGTFKTVPPLFTQLYTIHGVHFHNVIPSVFALLPDKTEATYSRLFKILKNLEPYLNPVSVMTDFETASINAFRLAFPDSALRGCLFHMSQCVWRHVQAHGLAARYANDADFALHIRMLPALAFVPLQDVTPVFTELIDCDYYLNEAGSLQEIVDYFEDVWIGRLGVRGRRAPKFAQKYWNCFDAVQDDLPRTNNAVEGWHRRFNEIVGAQHPTIWRFIESLKKEQKFNEMCIEQFIQGRDPPSSKKVYREISVRIKNVVNSYGMLNNIDYLRGIAHNLTLNV